MFTCGKSLWPSKLPDCVEDGMGSTIGRRGGVLVGFVQHHPPLFSPHLQKIWSRYFLTRTFSVFFAVLVSFIAAPIMLITALLIPA